MSSISELLLFLSNHRITDGEPPTHTGMYYPLQGSWHIPHEDVSEFWQLYNKVYSGTIRNNKRLGIGLTEVQPEYAPLLVDLDFKYDVSKGYDRLYTVQHDVLGVLELYRTSIKKCIALDNDNMAAHIFEKPKPRLCGDKIKDGVHAMFLGVILPKHVRKWIQNDVKRGLKDVSVFTNIVPPCDTSTLIDDCASTNNWLLYGCVKKDDQFPYKLTHIVDSVGNLRNVSDEAVEDPSEFTVQHHDRSEILSTFCADTIETIKTGPAPAQHPTAGVDDANKTKALLTMLSPRRYEEEPDWIRVGWCLHNISNTVDNMNIWIDWSKQSAKFKSGECEKQWKRFRSDGYTFASLCYWARHDNPEDYEQFIKENSQMFLEYSINCGAHYDIAQVLHCKYGDVYRSVNPKKSDEWYYYDNHRWNEMPGGYLLMNKMSVDLSRDFIEMANHHKKCMVHHDQAVVKEHTEKRGKCLKLEYSVKDNGFKTGVLKECARMFFDREFNQRLDSKPNLICFNNGVYEIDTTNFRDGQPDDYISKTTNIDYKQHTNDDPLVQEINEFLTKVQPNQNMRTYVMKVLASFLGGSTEEQTFQIWTGSGSNGKSTIIELFERTFGDDYCGKFPVTLLTKDRANSNACTPELQDVMKKRFASMQEPNDNDVIHTGAMKEYTGGDKIYSRGLFSTPTPFKPQFKLVLLCNKMPQIKGWDFGTWRRIRVVNFTSSFVDEPNPNNPNEYAKDKRLSEKFDVWKEAFMWMLIEHLKMYKKQGMKEPIQVTQASKDYKKRSDSFLQFMDDNYEYTGNEQDRMSCQEVIESFKMWWRNINTTPVPPTIDLMDYISGNTKFKKIKNTHFACIINKNVVEMTD